MKRSLADWLLESPALLGISTLARDAHECGLIDLRTVLPNAITCVLRAAMNDLCLLGQPTPYHQSIAAMHSMRRKGLRVIVDRGVARIQGSLGCGVGLSENQKLSVLHLRQALPETACTAMVGRDLRTIVETPLFRQRLPVTCTERRGEGLSIIFATPGGVIARDDVIAMLMR